MNALQQETSPYLLQHAHNPVDWHAWKPEVLARAKAEDKPILVSIGYSTCHWCHVMERESFENEAIAEFMNAHFICIKVDREERPDVDAVYMEACQILTGGGGWPLNCFLTPETKPFYAGTYFPPAPAYNRPSWLQLLQHLANIWATQRDTALEQADKLLHHIERNDAVFVKNIAVDTDDILLPGSALELYASFQAQFDPLEGGFGGAPKFPATMSIQFLLEYYAQTQEPEALQHAHLSLQKMIQGGIYDQIGGGFARYATDRAWLVPHFEKMLYDNALLVSVLSDAYKLTQLPIYAETIVETLDWVAREMTHPEGGFYAALDADSEGVEGKFYVWQQAEIETVLGDAATLFGDFYQVTAYGNWEETNILWRPIDFEQYARLFDLELTALKNQLKTSRQKLLLARGQRIRPGLDHKILLSWNALMVTAYVDAFTALGHASHRTAAVRGIDFLLERYPLLPGAQKTGAAAFCFLDDYAFLIAALIDVYQITFDEKYLSMAGKYTEHVLSYFSDDSTNLFFFTDIRQTDIILRKKDLYDNAMPSGNSTMVLNLQRLGILLDRREWRERAKRMLEVMQETIARYPRSFSRWAQALLHETGQATLEIAIVGDNAYEKAVALQQQFLPNKVLVASRQPIQSLPLLADKPGAAEALIYVCRDFSCQRPVTSLAEFKKLK